MAVYSGFMFLSEHENLSVGILKNNELLEWRTGLGRISILNYVSAFEGRCLGEFLLAGFCLDLVWDFFWLFCLLFMFCGTVGGILCSIWWGLGGIGNKEVSYNSN